MAAAANDSAAPPVDEPPPTTEAWHPNEKLAAQLQSQWEWVGGAVAKFQVQQEARAGWLRATVRGAREGAAATAAAAASTYAAASSTYDWLTTPSDGALQLKARALELRRAYPGAFVAAVTAVSVLPALRARSPGAFLRYGAIGAGGSVALLYPELVMRCAPHVREAQGKLESKWKSATGSA